MNRRIIVQNIDIGTHGRSLNTIIESYKTTVGWKKFKYNEYIERLVYLGKCNKDGDMFAIYWNGFISLGRGKLNNGVFDY